MNIAKLLGILLVGIIGCSSSMVGKQMPPANYTKMSPDLQYIDLKLIEIQISTETDMKANTVTAKGVIAVVKDELPPGAYNFSRVNVKAFLMDNSYTVIREVSFSSPAGANKFAPIPYEVTFPYDPAYRYLYITGKVHYWK